MFLKPIGNFIRLPTPTAPLLPLTHSSTPIHKVLTKALQRSPMSSSTHTHTYTKRRRVWGGSRVLLRKQAHTKKFPIPPSTNQPHHLLQPPLPSTLLLLPPPTPLIPLIPPLFLHLTPPPPFLHSPHSFLSSYPSSRSSDENYYIPLCDF